jgi:hypothetical protein
MKHYDNIKTREGVITVWDQGVCYEVVDEQWARYIRESRTGGYDPFVRVYGHGNQVPAGGCDVSPARLAEAIRLMGGV